MDKNLLTNWFNTVMRRIREGFEGQILYVIPRPLLKTYAEHPLVFNLMPTDIGYYPNARFHYCERDNGINEYVLIVCSDGEGWLEIDNKKYNIKINQAAIIPRNTQHIYGGDKLEPWSIHWVHFGGHNAEFFGRQLKPNEYILNVDQQTLKKLIQLFTDCYSAFATNFVLQSMIYASQTLHHLLATLFFDNQAFSPTLKSNDFYDLEDSLIYLEQNIYKTITLDDLAKRASLSKSHFTRLFSKQTGHSPIAYFIHMKMQHACKLLSLTNKTIREISMDLGYEDPYYFSRLFKKIIGVSPKYYRTDIHKKWDEQ